MAWTDIIGQDHAVSLLRSHAASGQVASAYLLTGPEGAGKRRLALEMAKALNCAKGSDSPCDACPACAQIAKGTHPDLHVLSPSGAAEQIRIEPARQMLERIALRPFNARYQIVIIDGAERLTEEAANCLLKALEEPPAHTRFLLLTTRMSDCLPTIISRCQLIRFRPLPREETAKYADRFAAPAAAWLELPLPETRDDVGQLIEEMVQWLRAQAVRDAGAGADTEPAIAAVFELLSLRESLDQFANPKLVASLAREHWLSLVGAPRA